MRKIILQLAIFIFVCANSALLHAGGAPSESAKDYSPPEGTTKVMEMLTITPNGEKRTESRLVVGKQTEFRGKVTTPLKSTPLAPDQKGRESTSHYIIDQDAIYTLAITTADNNGSYYDPPLKTLQLPLKAGLTWENRYLIKPLGESGTESPLITATYTVMGKETIDTPAGKLECWKITAVTSSEDGSRDSSAIIWTARKVGLVNYIFNRAGAETTVTLKSLSLK